MYYTRPSGPSESYAQKRQHLLRRLAETPYSEIRQRIEGNLTELTPPTPRRVVTEWSESCACGGNFLGHEEEPCRPDCTGYYPVREYIVLGHSAGGPQAAGQPGDSYGPTMAGPCYD
ncbi:hypothetical protein ACPXCO_22970 [Streptomyces cyaneofuscatus]|uniref:hypothetical protein n=1 Tax=Streptomyces cyaneofuscatus TaxID=66883 RepID=UPI003CEE770A